VVQRLGAGQEKGLIILGVSSSATPFTSINKTSAVWALQGQIGVYYSYIAPVNIFFLRKPRV
jgi:hypothetical protein